MGREPFSSRLLCFSARLRSMSSISSCAPAIRSRSSTGRSSRVSLLTLVGLAAAVLGLAALNVFAPRGQGVYVPAHMENGVLVPGRIE